jgi:hypothetical protein
MFLLLLMSIVAVTTGAEVIDYMERAIKDTFDNSTPSRGTVELTKQDHAYFLCAVSSATVQCYL